MEMVNGTLREHDGMAGAVRKAGNALDALVRVQR